MVSVSWPLTLRSSLVFIPVFFDDNVSFFFGGDRCAGYEIEFLLHRARHLQTCDLFEPRNRLSICGGLKLSTG